MDQVNGTAKLLNAAFRAARTKYPDLLDDWVLASHRIGSKLPRSLLAPAIQRDGQLDVLIRGMEDEFAAYGVDESEPEALTLQNMMSEYWIGGMYAALSALRRGKLLEDTEQLRTTFRDTELVRVTLEKHQIAKDRDLDEPLILVSRPQTGSGDEYIYSRGDNTRAHIMPKCISERGSITWHVIDLRGKQSRWVERRALSDQVLQLWAIN